MFQNILKIGHQILDLVLSLCALSKILQKVNMQQGSSVMASLHARFVPPIKKFPLGQFHHTNAETTN